jgi:glycosyltransferase involved in cell wall biosynthesis
MRIGINEVLVYSRSSGTRQREMNVLPEVLTRIRSNGGESVVYVARDLNDELICRLIGGAHRCAVVRTPLPSVPTYQRVLRGIPYWHKQVVRDRLDVFHTAYYSVPRLPIPIVLTVNDVRFVHLPDTYPRFRRLFLCLVVPSSLKRATRIITISQDTKQDLIHFFGVREEKIDVIPIAADTRFRPVVDISRLALVRERYNLPEHFILYVGHLEPRKNLDRLVRAFVQLCAQDVTTHSLIILGKPSFGFESMLDRAKRSGFASRIVLTGYVEDEDMPAVYTLADALVFPSLHEGFGVPLLEAMACGVPIVTSNVSALPEIAGDAAILVDPYNVESIAGGIVQVLSDEGVRQRLVEKGFERVNLFSVEKSAAATVETYKKALGSERV